MSIGSQNRSSGENALAPRITVNERTRYTLDTYPENIVDQLKRAAFSETEAANTYEKYARPANDTGELKIATVEISNEGLVIETEDVIGLINLTPSSTLQINPKVGWKDILEMFLKVEEQQRALDYRGIPVRDFLADDIGIKDVFIVVALNYLDSLDTIVRHGFIRSFDRQRTQGLQGRGRIDIERSIKNFDIPNGVPKHVFIDKKIEYGIPVNDLIYKAGIELKRLFQFYSGSRSTGGSYARIFSRLEQAIAHLENFGIKGTSISRQDIPKISADDIPRQRHYYDDAIRISKTILSSTIGQPLDQGREELLMEYMIGMESLFEEYTDLALREELEKLRTVPTVTGLDSVSVSKRSYSLFTGDKSSLSSRPDHVFTTDEGEVEAILDSKYYDSSKNPLKQSWARSRLFSYGFHLQVDRLGMIVPLGDPSEYEFKNRTGKFYVVAPEEPEFTTEGLRESIRSFLRNVIGEKSDMKAIKDIDRLGVAHPDISISDLNGALESSILQTDNIMNNLSSSVREITKYIDDELSAEAPERGTHWVRQVREFKGYLSEHAEECDVVVPIFINSEDEESDKIQEEINSEGDANKVCSDSSEFIRLYCFHLSDAGDIIDWEQPQPFVVEW